MKRAFFLLLLVFSNSVMSEWVSDISIDKHTQEKVGYVALKHDVTAFSAGCQENAGLVISFYWSDVVDEKAFMEIQIDGGDVITPKSLWYPPSNSTYPESPSASVELIKAIRFGEYLTVKIKLADGSMSSAINYDLSGFSNRFQKACDWHPGYATVVS